MTQLKNLEGFKKGFAGEVILPNDGGYDQASKTMFFKGAPAVIVKPKNPQEVAAALEFGQDNALAISIRCGGHSIAGFGTNTGGMVMDLSAINDVTVTNPKKGLVSIGGGAKWVDVGKKLQEHGLAISSGDTKTVGVGGLTLGAGIGWMVRKYGLAIDSMVGAEVVTANGEIVHTNESENPDLFWALRGGGGNFGVVTKFEFVAHPTHKVHAGVIMYSLDNLAQTLKGWRNVMRSADPSLNTIINVMSGVGDFPAAVMLLVCYDSPNKAEADKAIGALLKIGTVTSSDIKEKFYYEVLEDAHPPEGLRATVRNVFAKEFTDEIIDAIVERNKMQPPFIMQIRSMGDVYRKISADAMAFAWRDSEVLMLSPTFLPLDATPEVEAEMVKPWGMIAKFGHGAYINFAGQKNEEAVMECYPPQTLSRLKEIKRKYDPKNIFNQNINIQP
jgi:FAD/FMN-containing dehydrogenase